MTQRPKVGHDYQFDNKMLQPHITVTYSLLRWIYRYKQYNLRTFHRVNGFIFVRRLQTTVHPMAIRLFEGQEHAKLYAKYRPTYPNGVFEEIVKYCKSGGEEKLHLGLAVDVGCGSGQSTRPLCRYFRHVIGTDVSEEQIKSAIAQTGDSESAKISFHNGPGEDLSFLKDSSVDLITIAQALHWLNPDLFYSEVRRVLKPNGVFAAYGYGNNVIDVPEADNLQHQVN